MDSSHGLSTIVQSEAKVLLDRYGNSMSEFELVRQMQPVLPNLCGNTVNNHSPVSDGVSVRPKPLGDGRIIFFTVMG